MNSWGREEWRWSANTRSVYHQTISVIEPPTEERQPATVPFGFARALAQPAREVEPTLWDGDQA